MTHVLTISMDASLLSRTIGDSRQRHLDYAQRIGTLDIVVCTRGQWAPFNSAPDAALRIRPTVSRFRFAYVPDGYRAARLLTTDRRPDVITTQDPFLTGLVGLLLKRRLHVPLIIQDHSSIFSGSRFASESRLTRLLHLLGRLVVRGADAVRVVNTAERAACIRLGIPADRVQIIPLPTALQQFVSPPQPIDWRARLNIAADAPTALWVGRVVPVKNLPLLLEAFAIVNARLPSARLILAGDTVGSAVPALIERLRLGDAVRLAGTVSHELLPALYQAATVYAHSSRYEGFGVVLVEAAAAGLPLISTMTDGARDIIRPDETGLIVPDHADALADALLTLLTDPERAQAMGHVAQADVLRRFDPETLAARWVGLWQTVAAAAGSNSDQ